MNHNPTPTMLVTAEALNLLSEIATEHPELPAPYLTVSTLSSTLVNVQCQSLPDFELWRVALGYDSALVSLSTTFMGVEVRAGSDSKVGIHLYVPMPEQVSPRPVSEWEERLASLPSDWRAERAA
ncbi:hypothetical protein [Streptomyces sp. NPDC004285]